MSQSSRSIDTIVEVDGRRYIIPTIQTYTLPLHEIIIEEYLYYGERYTDLDDVREKIRQVRGNYPDS